MTQLNSKPGSNKKTTNYIKSAIIVQTGGLFTNLLPFLGCPISSHFTNPDTSLNCKSLKDVTRGKRSLTKWCGEKKDEEQHPSVINGNHHPNCTTKKEKEYNMGKKE